MRISVQGVGEVDVAQVLVVKGDHAALLGRKTTEELGLLRVGIAADVYFTIHRRVNHGDVKINVPSGFHWLH